jgi:hypothetical protein
MMTGPPHVRLKRIQAIEFVEAVRSINRLQGRDHRSCPLTRPTAMAR